MKKIITYIADDGRSFDNELDCVKYEEELKTQRIHKIQQHAYDIDVKIWNEYMNEGGNEPTLENAIMFLRFDIPDIVLRSSKKPTLDEIKNIFLTDELADELLRRVDFSEIKKELDVRMDWESALKNVKCGSDLSSIIGWSFSSKYDIPILAKLHKSNKFRKKIENLLTDCNFHKEVSDFSNKMYDEYLI